MIMLSMKERQTYRQNEQYITCAKDCPVHVDMKPDRLVITMRLPVATTGSMYRWHPAQASKARDCQLIVSGTKKETCRASI